MLSSQDRQLLSLILRRLAYFTLEEENKEELKRIERLVNMFEHGEDK